MHHSPVTAGPLRIVLVISRLHGGGAERVVATLAAEWAHLGHQVTVVTTLADVDTCAEYTMPGAIARIRLETDLKRAGRFAQLAALIGLVRRLRAVSRAVPSDVVIGFVDVTNVLLLLANLGARRRIVVCERTAPSIAPGLSRSFRALRRVLYRRAARVVAQTGAAADWIGRDCRCPAIVLPNPLRPLPAPPDPAAREALVLAVGRLDERKGVDVVIRAFAAAHRHHPGWALAVLGEGPVRGELRALAASLGVDKQVHFVGHVDRVDDWYARAAILAHGSRVEGFPNVLLEAMAMGACVVSTDCPHGPAELIDEGRSGFLVPVDDAAAMAERLGRLMNSPPLRTRIAHAAMQVRQRHDGAAVAARWLDAVR
jgi:glycosyltransferase involved in cell wall biosynthesis